MILPKRELVGKKWFVLNDLANSFVSDPRCQPGVLVFLDHDERGVLIGDISRFSASILTSGLGNQEVVVRELVDFRDLITVAAGRRNKRTSLVTDDQVRALREDARATEDSDCTRACSAALGIRVGDGAGGFLDKEECRERVAAVILSDRYYSVEAIEERKRVLT